MKALLFILLLSVTAFGQLREIGGKRELVFEFTQASTTTITFTVVKNTTPYPTSAMTFIRQSAGEFRLSISGYNFGSAHGVLAPFFCYTWSRGSSLRIYPTTNNGQTYLSLYQYTVSPFAVYDETGSTPVRNMVHIWWY